MFSIDLPNKSDPNRNLKIWRYINFSKFKDLLDTNCLFFSRVDTYKDSFEGRSSEFLHALFEKCKKRTYANCWHQNDSESNLMWDSYIKKGERSKGIAIQSSEKRFRQCFADSKIDQNINDVTYYKTLDIDKKDTFLWGPEKNVLIPFFRKSKEFEMEKEFRAVIQITDNKEKILERDNKEKNLKKGIYIKIDLNTLIESIYISPYSKNPRFITKVKKIASKHNLKAMINESKIVYQPTTFNKHKNHELIKIEIEQNTQYETDASGNLKKINNNKYIVRGQKKTLITF
jgi:hypothetical protein